MGAKPQHRCVFRPAIPIEIGGVLLPVGAVQDEERPPPRERFKIRGDRVRAPVGGGVRLAGIDGAGARCPIPRFIPIWTNVSALLILFAIRVYELLILVVQPTWTQVALKSVVVAPGEDHPIAVDDWPPGMKSGSWQLLRFPDQ